MMYPRPHEPEGTNFTCLARFAESVTFHGEAIQVFPGGGERLRRRSYSAREP
jgi:hypothetical protein